MSETPVPRDPGRDEDPPPVPSWPDWMDDPAYLASRAEDEDPGDPDLWDDPDNAPPPGLDDAELDALIAEAREITADQARAAEAAARLGQTAVLAAIGAMVTGRRGPGMPGSVDSFPGGSASPAAGFASGEPLDVAPGCATLGLFVEDAAGEDDRYAGASDDELLGVICASDRAEAAEAARKHAAIAELIRRRPAPGRALEGPAEMPTVWHEFTARELGAVLGVSGRDAEEMLGLAWCLEVNLPSTKAAFCAGILSRDKAAIIAMTTALLDPAEARAAESMVLDRAGSLTPGALRDAIKRAVMEVNPDKARKRREHMAKRTRVERWAEDSGNAGLAGRELPPAEVLAADQRVTAWARELCKAGLEGSMDALRARAYLDILLGIDSRPIGTPQDDTHGEEDGGGRGGTGQDGNGGGQGGTGQDGNGGGRGGTGQNGNVSGRGGTGQDGNVSGRGGTGQNGNGGGQGATGPHEPRTPAPAGPLAGVIPPGFAGRVTLTIPAITLLDRAGRPGELADIGPIDPDLARDLASAAARNPRSIWCVTVTDSQGHAVGHGCARPAPATGRRYRAKRDKPGAPGGPDPPSEASFAFTATDRPGPPGGYGTWRFSTGVPGQRDLLIEIGPIPIGKCDHRHQARGHDPGVMLRHLAQVRHATCTGPGCRRPSTRTDFEHNVSYEAGGRTCLCNGNPKCRFDHRMKQDRRWKAEQFPDGNVRWTTPSGRQYTTEPTRYPI
jgi:Domain of unknown function (DUF222)